MAPHAQADGHSSLPFVRNPNCGSGRLSTGRQIAGRAGPYASLLTPKDRRWSTFQSSRIRHGCIRYLVGPHPTLTKEG